MSSTSVKPARRRRSALGGRVTSAALQSLVRDIRVETVAPLFAVGAVAHELVRLAGRRTSAPVDELVAPPVVGILLEVSLGRVFRGLYVSRRHDEILERVRIPVVVHLEHVER